MRFRPTRSVASLALVLAACTDLPNEPTTPVAP